MKLIVGLGNPGSEYASTRHNAGFMAVERLAQRHGMSGARNRFHAGVIEGSIAGQKVMLMQPMTYMNRSGLAVGEAARFHRLQPADILVVVDDLALSLGAVRLRGSGGPGGHNGLADVQRALGTEAYPRLRIGVGAPEIEGQRISQTDHVLGRFTDQQLEVLAPALDQAAAAVESWLSDGIELAMTRFNRKTTEEMT
jgi:peptidyl-tRNA hydrolase, PTH1 family